MKLRFGIKNQTDGRTNERTNGDIEALADSRRALEKSELTASEEYILLENLLIENLSLEDLAKTTLCKRLLDEIRPEVVYP